VKLPLPFDVRLMNITATVLFAACGVLLAVALAWWAVRHPAFAIRAIVVQGDVTHNSAATLRANVAPRLAGNFFTIDLEQARAAFEAVPWVRKAVVQRQFPNKLRVRIEEHQAQAFWGNDSESRLVNTFGEVFEANAGDVEQDDMHGWPARTAPRRRCWRCTARSSRCCSRWTWRWSRWC
jgi:cell division protein FtsQ